jgi:DNA-binding CsgD family transcriptional regulator
LAVLVFRGDRTAYQNATARRLVARVRADYGTDFVVTLRNHIADILAPGPKPPEAVSILTAPSGEPFYVHVRQLGRTGRLMAVSVREIGLERAAFSTRYGLSRREAQVVELVLRGHSNRDIAVLLGAAPTTVKKHLTRIFDKVGVDSRTRLLSRFA